ncbi:MAG: MATE family efflux transporter [Bacteroidota bacterium]
MLTYPIILGLLAENMINFIDTVFLGRVGEVALGGSAIGGLFYVMLFILGFGFSLGTQILISRRNGEGNYTEVGRIFRHSMIFLVVFAAVLAIVVRTAGHSMLRGVIASPNIYDAAMTFLDYRIFGLVFVFAACSYRAFFVGIMKTRILTYNALIMAGVNILLDYILIFGHWGFPKMGIAGAGIASATAEAVSLLHFYLVARFTRDQQRYGIFKKGIFDFSLIRSIFGVSFFTMLQHFIALGGWWVFFMIIEKTGEHPLAISNIVRSIYMIFLIPIWAFSSATNTVVSNLIGENRKSEVMSAIRRIALLCLAVVAAMVVPALGLTRQIISLYTNNNQLIIDSQPVLFVVLGVLIIFSFAMTTFSGVTGTGNTRTALLIECLAISIYLTAVYLISVYTTHSIAVIWCSEYIYIIMLAIFSFLYMRNGKWKERSI